MKINCHISNIISTHYNEIVIVRTFLTIMAVSMFALLSCSSNDTESRRAVEEWVGKEIIIPDHLIFFIQDEKIQYDFDYADYKIITYIDSTGCTSCKMKLKLWNDVINNYKTIPNIDFNFLMIIESTCNRDAKRVIRRDNFLNPVAYDSTASFSRINRLSYSDYCNTFLLDSDNKVIAIGNPATNPKIKELYYSILKSDSDESTSSANLCRNSSINIGHVKPGETVKVNFRLANTSDKNLNIQDIIPSCDCISIDSPSNIIKYNDYIDVHISYVADSIIGPIVRYADIFFKEHDSPQRLTLHGFIIPNK